MPFISWVVFDRPDDFPNSFVARKFIGTQATSDMIVGPTLESVRAHLPTGLYKLERHVNDYPSIVEVWI